MADVITDEVSSGSMQSEGVVVPPVSLISGLYSSSSAHCWSRRLECSYASQCCTTKLGHDFKMEQIHSPR